MFYHDRNLENASWNAWRHMRPGAYDKAVYASPLLRPVYEEELRVVQARDWSDHCLVEIGSGPGEFLLAFPDHFVIVVGIERSASFIEQAKNTSLNRPSVHHVLGDATELNELLKKANIPELWTHPKLVCCVMNTLGILEPNTRLAVLAEMSKLLDPTDSYMLTVFNRAHFAEGIQCFYQTSPELCGTVKPDHYDLQSGDLRVTETGYYSHWFDPRELAALLTGAGLHNFSVRAYGIALFALGGRLKDA